MRKLYCFDFDGTLTKRDTMFLFLRHYNPRKFYLQFILHVPLFIFLKLKLADAEAVKKQFIASVLKDEPAGRLNTASQAFFDRYYPSLIRQPALDFISQIRPENTECLLVTASLDIWVRPFAKHWGMQLLATEAHFENGLMSGSFATPNCNRDEKLTRIKKATEGRKFDKIIAFGDTEGDHAMLKWADEGHYRFFH